MNLQPCLQHSEVISAAAASVARSDAQQSLQGSLCADLAEEAPARASSWLLDERAEMKA